MKGTQSNGTAHNRALHHWPARSSDLTQRFFSMGFVKDMVFRPPLPANIEKLKERITAAIQTVMPVMLQSVDQHRVSG